jgi:hypothetical protein
MRDQYDGFEINGMTKERIKAQFEHGYTYSEKMFWAFWMHFLTFS